MRLSKMLNEEIKLEESLKDAILSAFHTLDMDDAMFSASARAYAYHINSETLFVDWLPNRGHGDWFKDREFQDKHSKELARSRGFNPYNAYRNNDEMERECIWGRFGMQNITKSILDLNIEITPEIESISRNGMPFACSWALGECQAYLPKCAAALVKFGLPEETVMYAAYKAEPFFFPPFFIGEEWRAVKKKEKQDYSERWRQTIGDAVEKYLSSLISD